MEPRLTVITCAHNPRRDYLCRVIEALKAQTLDKNRWQYLLIDNASDEPVADVTDLSWHRGARHIREGKLGLTHARLRGTRESSGEVLVFVDDDNVLDPDYLEQVEKIADQWPLLGAWAGQTRPGFETPPPAWTREYWGRLVIREFDTDRWSNQPDDRAMPCGAGMCVRRGVAEHYAHMHETGGRKIMLDRAGTSLVSGGDSDLAICACDLGLGMGLFTSLKLTHLIPQARLTEDYLVNLVEGLACSSVLLNSFRSNNGGPSSPKFSTAVADVLRLLTRNRRERRFFRAMRSGERKAFELLSNNH